MLLRGVIRYAFQKLEQILQFRELIANAESMRPQLERILEIAIFTSVKGNFSLPVID